MTFLFFDLKVRFFFSSPLGRPFLRKNINSLFFCFIEAFITDFTKDFIQDFTLDFTKDCVGRLF